MRTRQAPTYPFRVYLEMPPEAWPWVRPFLSALVHWEDGLVLSAVTQESLDGTVQPCVVTIAFRSESSCNYLRRLCRKRWGHKIVMHQQRLTPWTRLAEQNYRRESSSTSGVL